MSILNREEPGFERRAGNAVAFLTSLVLHIALLLILACWAFAIGKPSQGLLFSADIGESNASALDTIQAFELSPQYDDPQAELTEPEFSMNVEVTSALDNPNNRGASGLDATLTSLTLGDVVENLNGQGSGKGANFFGAYAEGNRFVYVLDSSRSMKGDRWTYACNQLIDSLNGLKSQQEFFVICFDIETTFLFNKPPARSRFYKADKNTVKRVRRWLRSRTLGRATMPAEALHYALDLNPDGVFLLSDGELQDNSLMMLRMINGLASEQRQIPIHTVHLFSMQGRRTLEQIAMENGGTFTPIEAQKGFGTFRAR